MSRNRELSRKLRYAKAQKTNKAIPRWILQIDGKGDTRYNNHKHNWRRNHLKL
ncbi:Ribosomal_protein L39 [Hexamita inflata]|uniref:Ribosomal protein L39 n=1 Tax=Hexamita inflata TaxID=28002 RepID=A0AA86TTQ3_9EUKA|nr:Ribosomal protein L39 [Hexamita inflata]CAI9950497.1 Ribosomal protein L39 [Hexamita inflata]CAI9960756.1 Ribosomal protein L39 [Hexamita inflata]